MKLDRFLICLPLICAAAVFYASNVKACGPKGITDVTTNVTITTNSTLKYVRCSVNGTPKCKTGTCNITFGETQVPSTVFANLTLCEKYVGITLCVAPSGDVSSFSCVTDIPGCPSGLSRYGDNDYSSTTTCQAAKPTALVICLNSLTGVYSCGFNKPGCASGTTQYPNSLITYTGIDTCQANMPTTYQRCIAVPFAVSNAVGVADVDCEIGAAVPTLCKSGYMMEPVPGTGSFNDLNSCFTFAGNIQCYYPPTNGYRCAGDLVGCFNGEVQTSNSMTASACQTYAPKTFARCVTSASATCRPAESVAWTNVNTKVMTAVVMSPLSLSCIGGESLMPSTTFTQSSCLSYGGKVTCYVYSINTFLCIDDFACVGTDRKALTAIQTSSPTSCAAFTAASYIRCTTGGINPQCRPIETGCYGLVGEVQNPPSFSFTTNTLCTNFVNSGAYLRCRSSSGTTYCNANACNGNDVKLTPTGGAASFADQATCNGNLYYTRVCYNAASAPDASGKYYSITFINDFDDQTGTCPNGGVGLSTWMTSPLGVPPTAAAALNFYQASTSLRHGRCNVNKQPVCRPDMAPASTATLECAAGETVLTSNLYMSLSSCNLELYWGKACYRPNTNPGSFPFAYTDVLALYDTTDSTLPTACDTTKDYDLSGWQISASQTITTAAFYGTGVRLAHIRCQQTGVATAICRPIFVGAATGGQNGCPIFTSEKRLVTASDPFATLQACLDATVITSVCYTPTATSVYYTLSSYQDTTNPIPTCTGPSILFAGLLATTTVPSTAAVDAAYQSAAILHWRCVVTDATIPGPVPVCRPDMNPNVANAPTGQCDSTTTAPLQTTSYNSYADCIKELYWYKICYNAIVTGYTAMATYDSDAVQCTGTDFLPLTLTFTKSATKLAAGAADTMYQGMTTLAHYRCSLASGQPICRPDMVLGGPTIDCRSAGETALGPAYASPYANLAACKLQLYWANPCYTATAAPLTYYTITAAHDSDVATSCVAAGDKWLLTSSALTIKQATTVTDTQALAAYTGATVLNHYRCGQGTTPICRPYAGADPTILRCATIVGTAETALTQATPTYSSLTTCSNALYYYKYCYTATTTAPYFTLAAAYDSGAACGGVLLTSTWDTSPTTVDSNFLNANYPTKAIPHWRCKLGTVPVCRPDQDSATALAQCAATETLLQGQASTWPSYQACQLELYWYQICYTPFNTAQAGTGLYYAVAIKYDTDAVSGCDPANDAPLSASFFKVSSTAGLTAASAYTDALAIPHTRCLVTAALPYCRPLFTATAYISAADPCPKTDIRQLTSTPPYPTPYPANVQWASLGACKAQLYWAWPCYKQQTAAQAPSGVYYTMTGALDYSAATDCPLPYTTSVQLSTTPGIFFGVDAATAQAGAIAAYTAAASIPHIRCKLTSTDAVPVTIPVCRPIFTAATNGGCPTGETRIDAATQYNTLQLCLNALYQGKACYVAQNTGGPDYYITSIVYDTDTPPTCPAVYGIQLGATAWYGGASKPVTIPFATLYGLAVALPHFRCSLTPAGSTPVPVCRPNMGTNLATPACAGGAGGVGGEAATPLIDSPATAATQYATLQACRNGIWTARACYTPLQVGPTGTNYQIDPAYDTAAVAPGTCAAGSTLLPTTPAWISADTQANLQTALTNAYPTVTILHVRCQVGTTGTTAWPVCRPTTCATGLASTETALADQSASYTTITLCNAQRYWAMPCYHPISTSPGSYSVLPGYDTNAYACTAGDTTLIVTGQAGGAKAQKATTTDMTSYMTSYYPGSPVLQIKHTRCGLTDGTPICRPTWPVTNCPPGETVLTGTTVNQFATLTDCTNSQYVGHICYSPNQLANNVPYYTLTAALDSAISPGPGLCQTGSLQLGTVWATGSTLTNLNSQMTTQYTTALTTVIHYRCTFGATNVCRPDYVTPAHCPTTAVPGISTSETQASATTYNGLSACNVANG